MLTYFSMKSHPLCLAPSVYNESECSSTQLDQCSGDGLDYTCTGCTHVLPQVCMHTPSIDFRHLPPNSARFGYATEEALFISVQLSTIMVSALRKTGSNLEPKHTHKHETHLPWVKRKVLSEFKRFWFYLSWCKQHGNIKQTFDIIPP